jgi:hypothetical protein
MLDHAVQAGASWEQIGAARGTSAGLARRDYSQWDAGQHKLLTWTNGQICMSDACHAEAPARATDPETCPGANGNPANTGIQASGTILCAPAGQDGQGMHWKLPGRACPATAKCGRPSGSAQRRSRS